MNSNDRLVVSTRTLEIFVDCALRAGAAPMDIERAIASHPESAAELRTLFERLQRAPANEQRDLSGDQRATHDVRLSPMPPPRLDRESQELVERLKLPRTAREHLARGGEVGSGGMSTVYRARDVDLDRTLALKLSRVDIHARGADLRRLRRFITEAKLTARLDHPGIVPVHEIGLDERGRVFFTMRLVEGRELNQIFELERTQREGWNVWRVLEVFLRVCDALSFAHSSGVVHRDLKPSNVMVGRFGEVYVMDWGLARELGSSEEPDDALEVRGGNEKSLQSVDGEVFGTPNYMSPEQARGERIGPASDVYAVGALLYEWLAGCAPYTDCSERDKRTVIERVIAGPPTPILDRQREASPELVAICEHAMKRELGERYPSIAELAQDIRRFLDGRVVHAFERGLWPELKKLVRRNRASTIAISTAALAVVLGLSIGLWSQVRTRQALELQAVAGRLSDLRRRALDAWPAEPSRIPLYERWLAEADALGPVNESLRSELALLRSRALPCDPSSDEERTARTKRGDEYDRLSRLSAGFERDYMDLIGRAESAPRTADGPILGIQVDLDSLARVDRRLASFDLGPRASWQFESSSDRARHDFIVSLCERLELFADPDPFVGVIASMRERLRVARELERCAVDCASAWSQAIQALRADPRFAGFELRPQIGLQPIGPDPRSGLWEFAHLASGKPARRDERGELVLGDETGLVFVLVPGAIATAGCMPPSSDTPRGPYIDAGANPSSTQLITARLDPIFISKYELTQAQWIRATGSNPSYFAAGKVMDDVSINGLHPVTHVSWSDCDSVLAQWGLWFPTELQWEYAARGGTTSIFWWGDDECLAPCFSNGKFPLTGEDLTHLDRWPATAPVDAFPPNPFGLLSIVGNAFEWTADPFWVKRIYPLRDGDGAQLAPDDGLRSLRGGSFNTYEYEMRSAFRSDALIEHHSNEIGVRPVRAIR